MLCLGTSLVTGILTQGRNNDYVALIESGAGSQSEARARYDRAKTMQDLTNVSLFYGCRTGIDKCSGCVLYSLARPRGARWKEGREPRVWYDAYARWAPLFDAGAFLMPKTNRSKFRGLLFALIALLVSGCFIVDESLLEKAGSDFVTLSDECDAAADVDVAGIGGLPA